MPSPTESSPGADADLSLDKERYRIRPSPWTRRGIRSGTLVALVYRIFRCAPTAHQEHAIQAWYWLHGHCWIDGAPIWERILWRGHWYGLHPPLSALVMLPSVILASWSADQTTIAVLLGGISAGLVAAWYRNRFLTAFWALGTVIFYEATLGASWGFCLILSTIPTLLALRAAVEEGPATGSVWCGVFAGLAALARYDLAMVWPIYAMMLAFCEGPSKSLGGQSSALPMQGRPFAEFLVGPTCAIGVFVGYSWLRFGTWHDIALWEWFRHDARSMGIDPSWGPFNWRYLPMNLYTAIFLGPGFRPSPPWVMPTLLGESILLTSPAFLIALNAPWDRLTALLWLAVALSMSGCMLVWSNGQAQFGARYWIQAYPFLIALCKRGWRGSVLDKALIIASIGSTIGQTLAIRLWDIHGFA